MNNKFRQTSNKLETREINQIAVFQSINMNKNVNNNFYRVSSESFLFLLKDGNSFIIFM